MTSLTIVTVAVVVYGVVNRRGYGRALALGGATPVGAAVVVGAVAVPTFYAVAIGALVGVGLRLLQSVGRGGGGRMPVPGSRSLVLLLVVGVLTTLVAPLVFSGLEVEGPSGLDEYLAAGVVTKSNIAQIVYLVLSVGVVAYLARSRWTGPQIVGTATCLATLLSFWSYLHTSVGLPFPEGFFDNSPGFAFIQTLPGGELRVRGIFSEPAGLATSCLVTIAYCSSRVRRVAGLHRLRLLVVATIAVFLGAVSTSTTFLVAGIALVAVAAVVATATFVLRASRLSRVSVGVLCACALAGVWVLPALANNVGQQLADKVASSSYTDRSNADGESYRVLLDTWGLGAGLGANRGSSFIATLLSTVGVAGTLLFVSAVVALVRRSWPDRGVRPAAWALIALLVCKAVSGPDLADSSGVLWLSLGVLAHAALRLEATRTRASVTTSEVAASHAGLSGPARQILPSG
ncbi:hypothetical protein ACI8AK_03995 [Geodermatophilus sp. SYSU D00867]